MDRGFCSLLPVLHPRSQLSTHAGDNRYTPTSRRCLLRERSRETSGKGGGVPCPFLGGAGGPGPKAFPDSGVRVSWQDEPLRGAPFPSGVLWPLGRGCEASAGRSQRWLLLILPCPSPRPSPGLALGCARHDPRNGPRPRLETPSCSQGRSTAADS